MANGPATGLAQLDELALGFINANRAAATQRAYTSDWEHFTQWADSVGLTYMPASPETVVRYVTHLAATGKKPATINRRLATISVFHQRNGLESPTTHPAVREAMKGIRRQLRTAQRQAAPAAINEIRRLIAHLPAGRLAMRDKALILVGFAGALRRSELVAINVEDLEEGQNGLILTVWSSKTDQEGRSRQVIIPRGHGDTCPVTAVQAWLDEAQITTGPVFRAMDRHGNIAPGAMSDKAVALVIKRRLNDAGIDPAKFSGHSLRAGFATTAAANGRTEREIANQTGHRSMEVLRRYIRMGTIWTDNAATTLGL